VRRDTCRLALVVVLLLGAQQALSQTARMVLRWKDVPGTQGYELQIAKDPSFIEVVLQTRSPTPAYRWDQLPSVTHWWRVRSFDSEGRPSEWSQPRTVSLDSTVPVQKLPVDEALLPCAQSVELVFEVSALIKEYLVEVSQSKDFAPSRQLTSKSPSLSLGALGAGTWFWRAKALDVRGRIGESTGARKFTIRPAAPKIAKPVPDVVLGAPTVTLSWSEGPCAVSWVVEASTSPKDRVSLLAKTSSLGFKPNAAGEYRWRVAAVDDSGIPGEWSQESLFKVRLATPSPRGESSTPLKLDLAWTPVVGATQYRVEIATDRDFKNVVSFGTSTGAQFRATDVAPGRVYWRVIAKDDKAHVSLPSEPRPVDVVAPEPLGGVVWLSPASDVVVKPGEPVDLAWSPVDNAIFYELELDAKTTQVPTSPKVLRDLAEGPHTLRIRAKGNSSRVSAWTELREIFVGVPPVSRAEVTLVGDDLHLVFRDAKGRPVTDIRPRVFVEKGVVESPVAREGFFAARWTAPADGEDVLRIEEREFVTELFIARPLPVMLSVSARAGGLFNFSSVASPTATAGVLWRMPVLSRRLGLEARAGVYAASRSVDFGVEQVRAQAWVFPFSLLVGWHQPVGPWVVRGGVGPAFQLALLSVGSSRETRVVGDVELAVGLARPFGPGSIDFEVSGLFGSLDSELVTLSTSGLGLRVGYSFDLGGR
jgi:hypothetical protein